MITLQWLIVILGLFLGTYIVRALPFWWDKIDSLPRGLTRFLELVPAAAIGALIFPDVFALSELWLAITAVSVAFALTLLGLHLTLVVIVTVLAAWIAMAVL